MTITTHNKLVRDNIPEKIEKHGEKSVVRALTEKEFDVELKRKLLEEAREVQDSYSREEISEELADVFEVIDAICKLHSISKVQIEHIQAEKRKERGGFEGRVYLEYTEKN